ncbi:Uncharacterized protein APZ42_018902 [Daphnia magna]|uniref:Uncharacterized protein n=1 Tax=Daphnia magna TaxID=35525 RepID=A0A164YW16_9CRUS|nr:Uncharacterized protein APZ42_018902 [Daphnia magna]
MIRIHDFVLSRLTQYTRGPYSPLLEYQPSYQYSTIPLVEKNCVEQ